MPPQFQKIHVIINPASGQDEPILNTLNNVFQEYDIEWDVSITHQFGDGERHARAAIEAGCDLIAAYGGDGTMADVANAVIGTDMPMMILPGGTANALAQELHIPLHLEDAARLITDCEIQCIDVGIANDRHFLLRADMGGSVQIVDEASRELKDQFGIWAYGLSALKALSGSVQRATYHLTINGEQKESAEGIICLIGNANEIGTLGLSLRPDVDIQDGLLDVFIFNSVAESLLSAAAEIIRIQEGTATTFRHWKVSELHVEADPVQGVRCDGEPLGSTPLHARVIPQAIRVLTPRQDPSET
ncbi:MAG: diacylglycerol kinase family lipid kinase [Anaerolineae bacterium]|nr:diacylglycerol kinase family lipid kinase [Anaerolineae bacterium]